MQPTQPQGGTSPVASRLSLSLSLSLSSRMDKRFASLSRQQAVPLFAGLCSSCVRSLCRFVCVRFLSLAACHALIMILKQAPRTTASSGLGRHRPVVSLSLSLVSSSFRLLSSPPPLLLRLASLFCFSVNFFCDGHISGFRSLHVMRRIL